MNSVSAHQLGKLLATDRPPLVLDVRLAEDHAAAGIPGSVNNCVFEVAFLDRLAELAPDTGRAIVICGSSDESAESSMAAEKLGRAGYADVSILDGGIAAWKAGGHPLDIGVAKTRPLHTPDGRKELDLGECRLEWLGRNLLNKHHGTVEITSGHLDFRHGELVGGRIDIDLRSMKCADLAGDDLHDVLIRHLMDHDFLDADEHPVGRLEVVEAERIRGATPGSPNLLVRADLTLRGTTRTIEFTATTGIDPEGRPAAQASFSIDRTKWGIIYGSGRFFDHLAGHLVNDLVEFQVRLITR